MTRGHCARRTLPAAAAALAIMTMGCAASWKATDHKYTSLRGRYTVETPRGWMGMRQPNGDYLLTQHGPQLQNIHIDRQRVWEPLNFTNQVLDTGMLISDVATIILDNSSLSPGVGSMRVVEVGPALVDGFKGFRALVEFRAMPGIAKRAILYGFMVGPWYYEFSYVATARHYFDLDANTFERFVSSFRFFNGFKRRAGPKGARSR